MEIMMLSHNLVARNVTGNNLMLRSTPTYDAWHIVEAKLYKLYSCGVWFT